MLWDALKELGNALGSVIRYRAARLVGRTPSPTTSARVSRQLDKLPDENPGLADELLQPVEWRVQRKDEYDASLQSEPIFDIWLKIKGGHKWTQYFEAYRQAFGARKNDPLRVLEIGVLNGAGLKLWREYFSHPDTKIVGIDITDGCRQYEAPAAGIHVRIGSQADPNFLAQVVREFGPFDLVIDDGSHNSSHILTSFNFLFLNGLADGGIYLVEDLHANYWNGWRDTRRSFLDICYEIVDLMHAHYKQAGPRELFVAKPSDHPMSQLSVPRITTLVQEVRFFDSIAVLYKKALPHVPFYITEDVRLGMVWASPPAEHRTPPVTPPISSREVQANRHGLSPVTSGLRLDLGCGSAKRDGFIGLDRRNFPGVDAVADLSSSPWVFAEPSLGGVELQPVAGGFRLPDDSVADVVCSHFLEHLEHNQARPERVQFMNELWRVMKPRAQAIITTPHWASARAFGDFTHADKPVCELFYLYLRKGWREANAMDNDSRVNPNGYWCDFESEIGYSLHPDLGGQARDKQDYAISWYKEAAQDLFATLTAIK